MNRNLNQIGLKTWRNLHKCWINMRGKRSGEKRNLINIKERSVGAISNRSVKSNLWTKKCPVIKISTFNARSVKNKDIIVLDYLKNRNIDVALITGI